MKRFPITKPLKVVNFTQLLNDLEHILKLHPGKDMLMRSLKRVHKNSCKLKMMESLTQACVTYFSSLEPKVLKVILGRMEACVAGSVEGIYLSEAGLVVTKESVRTIALVNGSGKESCLIYLWKEGQLLYSKLKAKNNLYLTIKTYLDLSISGPKAKRMVEAECEWHLIQISKWMKEIHEIKNLGQWVSCDVLMNRLNDKWEELAKLWLLKVKESKINSKTRLSFLRSLIQRFPQCRLSAEKSGVLNMMLSWSESELKLCVKQDPSNLQNLLTTLRYLFWLDSLTSKDSDSVFRIKDHAKVCYKNLLKVKNYWLKLLLLPSCERGLNVKDHRTIHLMIQQLESLIKTKGNDKQKLNFWILGDEYTSSRSGYQKAFRKDLKELYGCLLQLQDDIQHPNALEKDLSKIWKSIKAKESSVQGAFLLTLKHPKLRLRSQYRNLFVKWFFNRQSLQIAI